jgi:O-antigen/teichoic acid export membrane protein
VSLFQRFLKGQVVIAIGFASMNVGNYLTSIIAGRSLSSATFSSYIALTSLVSIVTTVSGLSQNLISHALSRETLLESFHLSDSLTSIVRKISMIMVVTSILWMLAVPVINILFGGNSLLVLIFSTFFVVLATLLPALVGVANGLLNFRIVSIAFFIGGISRPFVFLFVTQFSRSLIAPVIALNISLLLTCAILLFFLPERAKSVRHLFFPRRFSFNRSRISIIFMMLSGAILSYSDTLVARLNLRENESADFAVSAILTNITLYGSLVVISVMIPMVTKFFVGSDERILFARWSIGLVAIFGIAYSLMLLIWGDNIVIFSMGEKFSVTGTFIAIYNLSFVGVSLVVLTVNFAITSEISFSIGVLFLLISLGYLTGMFFLGTSGYKIVACTGVASVTLLLISLSYRESLLRTAFSSLRPSIEHD